MVNVVEDSCRLPLHDPSRRESLTSTVAQVKATITPNVQIVTASLQIHTRRVSLHLLGLQQFKYSQRKFQQDMEQKLTVSTIIN